MKIRNGFVSNSSSSSFVVHYKDSNFSAPKEPKTFLFSKEVLKKLKKFGFKFSSISNPYYVGTSLEQKDLTLKSFKKWEDIYLTYDVVCNQDDVIYFLLENKLPFVALCHYEQELVVWDGKSDFFYQMPNPLEKVSRGNGTVQFDVGESSQFMPAQLCPRITTHKIDSWLEKERMSIFQYSQKPRE